MVPFWNEVEGALRTIRVLDEAASHLTSRGVVDSVEIVTVDDGSTDGTGALLDECGSWCSNLHVTHHESNQGLGGALRTGFRACTSDWIFYTDSDLPVDPLVSEHALRAAHLHDADIVACYRLDRTGEGRRRAVLSAAYNVAVRAVTRLPVRDVNFAAKLVRRNAVVDHLPVSNSLFFDAEMLARSVRAGATVQQIGVDYFPRSAGTSTLSSAKSIRDTAADLVRIGPRIRLGGRH